jgi:hypothetical protein
MVQLYTHTVADEYTHTFGPYAYGRTICVWPDRNNVYLFSYLNEIYGKLKMKKKILLLETKLSWVFTVPGIVFLCTFPVDEFCVSALLSSLDYISITSNC